MSCDITCHVTSHCDVRICRAAAKGDKEAYCRHWRDVPTPATNCHTLRIYIHNLKVWGKGRTYKNMTLKPTDKNLFMLPAMLKDVALSRSRVLVPDQMLQKHSEGRVMLRTGDAYGGAHHARQQNHEEASEGQVSNCCDDARYALGANN